MNDVIRRASGASREDLTRDNVGVRLELASDLPPVDGNVSQLQQVISNLIRNALEAMKTTVDRPRELRLRTERRGQDVVGIAVEDSEPGLDPTRLESAFSAFFTTKVRGMGLGLAICRLIVERHGGTISASSDGESDARFDIAIPAMSNSGPIRKELVASETGQSPGS